MEQVTLKCDVCKISSAETDGWLVAITDPPSLERPGSIGIAFGPIDAETFDPEMKREHICGQECAHKRLSIWLANNNL